MGKNITIMDTDLKLFMHKYSYDIIFKRLIYCTWNFSNKWNFGSISWIAEMKGPNLLQ